MQNAGVQLVDSKCKAGKHLFLFALPFIVGLIMAPKGVHFLNFRTCEYVIFCSKRDFADMIRLRICRWEDYTELSRWAPWNYNGP